MATVWRWYRSRNEVGLTPFERTGSKNLRVPAEPRCLREYRSGPVSVVLGFIENPRHDLVIGLVAAALIVFSLVCALVLPRRNPDFPGGRLVLFAVVAVVLVAAMLASVEALGETQHFGKAAEESTSEPAATTTGETDTSTATTGGGGASGNPANGKALFAANGCGTCHTYRPAGSTATVGPDLDRLEDYARQAKKPLDQFVRTSIVDPGAYVQPGFPDDIMPTNFGEKLSDAQLADLVAFLTAG